MKNGTKRKLYLLKAHLREAAKTARPGDTKMRMWMCSLRPGLLILVKARLQPCHKLCKIRAGLAAEAAGFEFPHARKCRAGSVMSSDIYA